MEKQDILIVSNSYTEINDYVESNGFRKILLVSGNSIRRFRINSFFESLGDRIVRFDGFQPNPQYESVVAGVKLFLSEGCDAIFAVGGGSALDVAKCIKLYSNMDQSRNYLEQEIVANDVKLLALPTTAGTGSEATRYAVIYYDGTKQSVTHDSIIPSAVVFDASTLTTLPIYQKSATLMDALCHSIESFWSVHSTQESRAYSKEAIKLIMDNWETYLAGDNSKNEIMLKAANTAGKAINITQTTAGHAMCYKLTSLYGIAHGHAVALCVPALWEYMVDHLDCCIDSRGRDYVSNVFTQISEAMGYNNIYYAIEKIRAMVKSMKLGVPQMENAGDFNVLKSSVNPVRLKNNPISLSMEAIDEIYHKIFRSTRNEG